MNSNQLEWECLTHHNEGGCGHLNFSTVSILIINPSPTISHSITARCMVSDKSHIGGQANKSEQFLEKHIGTMA